MNNIFSVEGLRIVITGASSGLGAHFATVLAEHGAEVILGARRIEKLSALVDTLQTAGGKARSYALDVTNDDSTQKFFDAVNTDCAGFDVLINNAGALVRTDFLETNSQAWQHVLDTNIGGVMRCSQIATRTFIRQGRGNILNISSIAAEYVPDISHPVYSASKAAVSHLTRTLAKQLGKYHVRVNAIQPGMFPSEMNDTNTTDPSYRAVVNGQPMPRTGELPELNGALFLLVSEASSFMTGSMITVDGGLALT